MAVETFYPFEFGGFLIRAFDAEMKLSSFLIGPLSSDLGSTGVQSVGAPCYADAGRALDPL